MARGDIVIRQEVRPCLIARDLAKYPFKKWSRALFHKWVVRNSYDYDYTKSGKEKRKVYKDVLALIEKEDGRMELVQYHNVKFLDSEWAFGEFEWEDEDETGNEIRS